MTEERWCRKSRWGGVNSNHWRGRYRWRAFNEGGNHATANIVFRDGWLPVAAYMAVRIPFIGWARITPRWQRAFAECK